MNLMLVYSFIGLIKNEAEGTALARIDRGFQRGNLFYEVVGLLIVKKTLTFD